MTDSKKSTSQTAEAEQMETVRRLILGDNDSVVTQAVRNNAREIVTDVFSEALHDRENHDGSVNTVLVPLVEKSVEKSIATHSEQYVGYLYPLVGSLVRKSVTAFITEILEKTNALIENSLTIKGLKWRFKARQAGISFSQYVITQTFDFRVEQVFLIHKETGLLLNSVAQDLKTGADADMVSAMLTAINDFVSDSFKPHQTHSEQSLDVIRTEDFTLIIKPGPSAVIVAAVTGNTPQHIANKLQTTLEDIHKLYDQELSQFNGDTSAFENSENQLRECLVSELKPEQAERKKKPWFAWIIFISLLLGLGYMAFTRFQTQQTLSKVRLIEQQAGIIVTQLSASGLSAIQLDILRDPAAIDPLAWLSANNIPTKNLTITQRAYLSLDTEIVKNKVASIMQHYPNTEISWTNASPIFNGEITSLEKLSLQNELAKVSGLNFDYTWLASLKITDLEQELANDPVITRAILDLNIAKIDRLTVGFAKGQSQLSTESISTLVTVKNQFNRLIQLAESQGLSLGLVIMGATDSVGSAAFNRRLSQTRANVVKTKLQELGIEDSRLNAIGLGTIDLPSTDEGARKVLFNVIYFAASE